MMVRTVRLSRRAQKDLRLAPPHVKSKLKAWTNAVRREGLDEVRKISGFHDEPLKGKRKRQRSIRLSRGYRAIYRVLGDGTLRFARVEEVTKHGY